VIARQGDGRWYLAGLNALPADTKLTLSLADVPVRGTGTMITDGDGGNLSFSRQPVQLAADKTLAVTLKPRGGFVIVFD
jgi:alpha-glucosidase